MSFGVKSGIEEIEMIFAPAIEEATTRVGQTARGVDAGDTSGFEGFYEVWFNGKVRGQMWLSQALGVIGEVELEEKFEMEGSLSDKNLSTLPKETNRGFG